MFAVVRHPDIDNPGLVAQGAFEALRARGWYRVSEWRAQPADFYVPDFADAPDLDEPEPEPEFDTGAKTAPAETTEESTE